MGTSLEMRAGWRKIKSLCWLVLCYFCGMLSYILHDVEADHFRFAFSFEFEGIGDAGVQGTGKGSYSSQHINIQE